MKRDTRVTIKTPTNNMLDPEIDEDTGIISKNGDEVTDWRMLLLTEKLIECGGGGGVGHVYMSSSILEVGIVGGAWLIVGIIEDITEDEVVEQSLQDTDDDIIDCELLELDGLKLWWVGLELFPTN